MTGTMLTFCLYYAKFNFISSKTMLAFHRIEYFWAFLSLKNRQYILKIELNPSWIIQLSSKTIDASVEK